MTKAEAWKHVLRSAAASLNGDMNSGVEYLYTAEDGRELSERECKAVDEAARKLIAELERRGGT